MKKPFKSVLLRAFGFLGMWLINIAIKLPTVILGIVMVALLYLYRKREFDDVPKVFLPWQNPEDWNGGTVGTEHSLPQWWINENGAGFWSWYHYHAIRNPANGLRNFDFIDLDLKEWKIDYWTPKYLKWYEPWYVKREHPELKTYGYVAWQGMKAGVKIEHIWNDERYLSEGIS